MRLPASHHDHTASPRQQIDHLDKVRLALRFIPDVDTLALGWNSLMRGQRDVVGLVVQHAIYAPGSAQLGLLCGTDRGDRFRAAGLGHLGDHRADAAGAAVDENGLAPLQVGAAKQPEVRCNANQGGRGRFILRHAGGNRVEPFLRGADIFRAGPLPAQQALVRAPDAVADLESF